MLQNELQNVNNKMKLQINNLSYITKIKFVFRIPARILQDREVPQLCPANMKIFQTSKLI